MVGTSNCTHLCANTIGSYSCVCSTGYRLGIDNVTCNGEAGIHICLEIIIHSEFQMSMNAFLGHISALSSVLIPLEATYVVATLAIDLVSTM